MRRSHALKHAASDRHRARVPGLGDERTMYCASGLAGDQVADDEEPWGGQDTWELDAYPQPLLDPEASVAFDQSYDNEDVAGDDEPEDLHFLDGHAAFLSGNCGSDKLSTHVPIGDVLEPSHGESGSPAGYQRGARNSSAVPPPDHPFYPFPDPTMMKIVIFVRSPKRRVGVQELEDLLDFGTALGLTNLPAPSTVKTFLRNLETEIPLFKPIENKMDKDRSVYVVSPQDYIAAHFATPSIAQEMQHYPVLQPAHIDSACHTQRWLSDLSPRFSAPMTRVHGVYSFVDYFVDEIVTLKGRPDYWFVERFVSFKGDVHAIVCSATVAPECRINVVVPAAGLGLKTWPHVNVASLCLVPATALARPIHEIGIKGLPAKILIRGSDGDIEEPFLPLCSIDRTLAHGKLLLVAPLRLFLDDLAATESNRWNPMYAASIQNLALPSHMIRRRTMLHHTGATDTTLDALDLADVILGLISETLLDRPVECFHSVLDEKVLVRLPIGHSSHDTPMAAACAARAHRGHFPCLRCKWGGSAKDRMTVPQMITFFECPLQHEAATTRLQSSEQIEEYASKMTMQSIKDMCKTSGTHDPWGKRAVALMFDTFKQEMSHLSLGVKPEPDKVRAFKRMSESARGSTRDANRKRARYEIKKMKDEILQKEDYIGPFFRVPEFDPHRHMPPDVLHVFLLGIVKYAWSATLSVKGLAKETPGRERLTATLASLSSAGLGRNIAVSHFIKFAHTLVGYDFVVLSQVMPLVSHLLFEVKLVPPALNECWSAIGKLGHHLHPLEVANLDRYATECEALVTNLLQSSMRRDLSHVLAKYKYHAFAGLGQAIRMFGPPRSFDSSLAESGNKILRQHSMRTNHHNVSRDIARKLGDTERVAFILRGGTWEKNGQRVGIGQAAKEHINLQPAILKWLPEVAEPPSEGPVSVRYMYAASSPVLSTEADLASSICFSISPAHFDQFPVATGWRKARLVVLPNGDHVHPEDWCLFRKQGDAKVLVGQVIELLAHFRKSVDGSGLVTIRPARVGSELAATGFLALDRTDARVVVTIEEVIALAVVQHDCSRSKCQPTRDADGGLLVHHATDGQMLLSTIAQCSFNELAAFRPSIKVPSPTPAFVTAILASSTVKELQKKTDLKIRTTKSKAAIEEVDADDEDEGGARKKRKRPQVVSVRSKAKGKPVGRTTAPMTRVDEETESDTTDDRERADSDLDGASSSAAFTDDCTLSTENSDSDTDMAAASSGTDSSVGTLHFDGDGHSDEPDEMER